MRNLGKRHVGYGVQDRRYDTVLPGTMKDAAAEVAGLMCNQWRLSRWIRTSCAQHHKIVIQSVPQDIQARREGGQVVG